MIHLMALHYHYLFSEKVIRISYVIIGLSICGFLLLSNYNLAQHQLCFLHDQYNNDYLFDGINFIKLISLMIGLFLVINAYVLHKYDVFLVVRVKDMKLVFISKILTLIAGNTVLLSYIFIGFTIVPLYLTSYFDADIHLFYLYGKIILFGNYYLILFIFTYVIGKNMYVMLLPICGYFCSNLSAEFYIGKNDVSWFTKSSNLLFEDIGYYLNTGFDFYYGFTYLLSILMLLIIAIVFLSIKSDILN